jgi:hypothetical protein
MQIGSKGLDPGVARVAWAVSCCIETRTTLLDQLFVHFTHIPADSCPPSSSTLDFRPSTFRPVPMTPKNPLYARFFTPRERRLLASISSADLSSEINLLRARIARFLGQVGDASAPQDFEMNTCLLNTLSLAYNQLASLINTQINEHIPVSEIETEREAGLELARLELGLLGDWEHPLKKIEMEPE